MIWSSTVTTCPWLTPRSAETATLPFLRCAISLCRVGASSCSATNLPSTEMPLAEISTKMGWETELAATTCCSVGLIFMACSIIWGRVIMKMITSTSATSTRGVMLMAVMAESCELSACMGLSGRLRTAQGKQHHHLHDGDFRIRENQLHPLQEVVVEHNGRDSHEQARRRGNQGFGDTHRHHAGSVGCGLGTRQVMEGLDNTHDGSQEADKGSRVSQGTQDHEITFHHRPLLQRGRAHHFADLFLGQLAVLNAGLDNR